MINEINYGLVDVVEQQLQDDGERILSPKDLLTCLEEFASEMEGQGNLVDKYVEDA